MLLALQEGRCQKTGVLRGLPKKINNRKKVDAEKDYLLFILCIFIEGGVYL